MQLYLIKYRVANKSLFVKATANAVPLARILAYPVEGPHKHQIKLNNLLMVVVHLHLSTQKTLNSAKSLKIPDPYALNPQSKATGA